METETLTPIYFTEANLSALDKVYKSLTVDDLEKAGLDKKEHEAMFELYMEVKDRREMIEICCGEEEEC